MLGFLNLKCSQRATSPNPKCLVWHCLQQRQPSPSFISDRKLKIFLIFVARQGDLLSAAQLNVKKICINKARQFSLLALLDGSDSLMLSLPTFESVALETPTTAVKATLFGGRLGSGQRALRNSSKRAVDAGEASLIRADGARTGAWSVSQPDPVMRRSCSPSYQAFLVTTMVRTMAAGTKHTADSSDDV